MRASTGSAGFFLFMAAVALAAAVSYDSSALYGAAFGLGVIGIASVGVAVKGGSKSDGKPAD